MSQRKRTAKLIAVTIVFVALAVVFVVLAIGAKYVYGSDEFARNLLLTLGSGIFGAGLTFFLIEIFSLQEEGKSTATRDEKSIEAELSRR